MGVAKPTFGYPTRTEAVVALRAQGVERRIIAERIGISAQAVGALERDGCSGRKHRQPEPAQSRSLSDFFLDDTLKKLRRHAAKRNLSVVVLLHLLVETAADNDLIDAVLDDAEERS